MIFLTTSLVAQNCGTVKANEQIDRDNQSTTEFEQIWKQVQEVKSKTSIDSLFIIPVVFHVVHNNGPENVSDDEIYRALYTLNSEFANNDSDKLYERFKHLAKDAKIVFRLATIDPNGNNTSGITRTQNSATYPGTYDLFNVIHWPHNSYLNIYIARGADGNAGYAFYPGGNGNYDGLVLSYQYLDYAISHEVGHWLHLHHTWGPNNDAGNASNCNLDDYVDDTPNCIGTHTCSENLISCGSYDNVENIMDYGCGKMFTKKQILRMKTTLQSSRAEMPTDSNLQKTGTNSPSAFQYVGLNIDGYKRTACYIYESLQFKGIVAPYSFEDSIVWDIPNGQASSLNQKQIEVRFLDTGWQFYSFSVYKNGIKVAEKLDSVEVKLPTFNPFYTRCYNTPQIDFYHINYVYESVQLTVEIDRGNNDVAFIKAIDKNTVPLTVYKSGMYPIKYHLLYDGTYSLVIVDTIYIEGYNVNNDYNITFDSTTTFFNYKGTIDQLGTTVSVYFDNPLYGYNGSGGLYAISYAQNCKLNINFPSIDFRIYEKAIIKFKYALSDINGGLDDNLKVSIVDACNNVNSPIVVWDSSGSALNTMIPKLAPELSDWRTVEIAVDSPSLSGFSDLQFQLTANGNIKFYLDDILVTGKKVTDSANAQFHLAADSLFLCWGEGIPFKNQNALSTYETEWRIEGKDTLRTVAESFTYLPKNEGWHKAILIGRNYFSVDTLEKSFYVSFISHDTSQMLPNKKTFCEEQEIELKIAGANDSIRWILPGKNSNSNPISYKTPKGTVAKLKAYVFQNGCMDTLIKNVELTPTIQFLSIYSNKDTSYLGYLNDSISFSVNGVSVDTFVWKMGNGTTVQKNIFKYIYEGSGNYNVRLIGKNTGCADTVSKVISVLDGFKLGVDEIHISEIEIIPNPFCEYFSISNAADDIRILNFTNSSGSKITYQVIDNSQYLTIKTAALTPGIYHILLLKGTHFIHRKVVKF